MPLESHQPYRLARVWDLPTRLFHWLLTLVTAAALVTGFLLGPLWLTLHLLAGWSLLALLVFRLVWGFTGSSASRFRSFLFAPRDTARHLEQLIAGHRGEVHPGHNPLGALMVFALIGCLSAIVVSGILGLGGTLKQGPLGSLMSFDLGAFSLEIHEALAFALLALVAGHLAGVVYESWRSSENLARSMATGVKRVPPDAVLGPSDPGRAAMILTGLGLIMLPAAYLGQTRQHPGTPDAAAPPSFLAECGSCHGVFHPSLMNRQNWGQVMAGLADHFGEDASLPDGEAREIAAYLQSHAAEAYDTKPARLIGRGGIPADLRITASAFWKRAHHTIDSTIFTRKSVGQRSNCGACHEDASTGRFAPQLISIPKE